MSNDSRISEVNQVFTVCAGCVHTAREANHRNDPEKYRWYDFLCEAPEVRLPQGHSCNSEEQPTYIDHNDIGDVVRTEDPRPMASKIINDGQCPHYQQLVQISLGNEN